MAYYTFRDRETKEEFTIEMKISELDSYKKDNPNLEQLIVNMNLCDPVRVGVNAKPSGGFRELLKEVKKKVPHNNINSF